MKMHILLCEYNFKYFFANCLMNMIIFCLVYNDIGYIYCIFKLIQWICIKNLTWIKTTIAFVFFFLLYLLFFKARLISQLYEIISVILKYSYFLHFKQPMYKSISLNTFKWRISFAYNNTKLKILLLRRLK